METIRSKDGTPIAYQRGGSGSPLVLVHGTSASQTRWAPILPALEKRFRVFAVDRRGRGESGDAEAYAFAREFEDVAAVVDSMGEPVYLLGHSYGAICSLEASLLTTNLRKLILYEPPVPTSGIQIYPAGVIDELQTFLDKGDRAAVVTTFFRKVVRMPPHELEILQASPAWSSRIAAAHTLPRELRAAEGYRLEPARFKNVSIPVLLLLGGDSPAFFRAAIEAVGAALPNSRTIVLPGQQHAAIDTATELFAREVVAFLDAPD